MIVAFDWKGGSDLPDSCALSNGARRCGRHGRRAGDNVVVLLLLFLLILILFGDRIFKEESIQSCCRHFFASSH